jgi:hypothetical protein
MRDFETGSCHYWWTMAWINDAPPPPDREETTGSVMEKYWFLTQLVN